MQYEYERWAAGRVKRYESDVEPILDEIDKIGGSQTVAAAKGGLLAQLD